MALAPNEIPHALCKGTGARARRSTDPSPLDTQKCTCHGSGKAIDAFARRLATFEGGLSDDLIDRALDLYVLVRYRGKRAAQVQTILQHSLDRDATDTVNALGTYEALFTWLCAQDALHCSDVREEDYPWP